MNTDTKRIRFILGYAGLTLVTMLLLNRGAMAQELAVPRDLADLIDQIRASVATDPPAGEHGEPDAAPDPNAPATLLFSVLQGIDQLLASREAGALRPPQLRRLQEARDQAAHAFGRYGLDDGFDFAGYAAAAARGLQAVAPSPRDPLRPSSAPRSNSLSAREASRTTFSPSPVPRG